MGRKMWAHWVHPSFKKGQAILELALFGSILIMLLGLLVSYGMKYNFQQQVMQQAFRKALASASDVQNNKPSSVSHIVIKDRHIPNPANPFAVGSVAPVSASASVTRNYQMQLTPDKKVELPQISLDINGQIQSRKAAALRKERSVRHAKLYDDYDSDGDGTIDDDEEDVSKYAYVYGSKDTTWWDDPAGSTGACACPLEEVCDTAGEGEETNCRFVCPNRDECKTYNIIIMDSCAGEIVDYDKMQNRCYQIEQAVIRRPWYCGEDYKPLASLFTFAQNYGYSADTDLGALSDENKPKMGLQGDYTQSTTMDNTLTKTESAAAITTTDTLDWQVDTTRTIVYNEGALDADGFSTGEEGVNIIGDAEGEGEITTSVDSGDYDWENWNEWETPF